MKFIKILCLIFLLSVHNIYAYDNIIEIKDKDGTWKESTDIDIFKDELIAPGVYSTYTFQVLNKSDDSINCILKSKMKVLPEGIIIPMQVRMRRENDWILGNEHTYVSIDNINHIHDSLFLCSNECVSYTIETNWPYEQDNTYDTYLGNLKEDINLRLSLDVLADDNESVSTDDNYLTHLYCLLMFISLIIFIRLRRTL